MTTRKIDTRPQLNVRLRETDRRQLDRLIQLMTVAYPEQRVDMTNAIRYALHSTVQAFERKLNGAAAIETAEVNGDNGGEK